MCHSGLVTLCFQGIVALAGKAHHVMLQGVHELYELNETPQLWEEKPRLNRLVFIGEDTDTHKFLSHMTLYTTLTQHSEGRQFTELHSRLFC